MASSAQASDTTRTIPVFEESIAGALIDSARISVMASLSMLPPPDRKPTSPIILPGAPDEMAEDPIETAQGCLEQAMSWLDAARQHTIEAGAPVTSLHVASSRRRADEP